MPASRRWQVILTGLGNVGRSFLRIVQSQEPILRDVHGIGVAVVGVADSTGAAFDPGGLDPAAVLAAKDARWPAGLLPNVGRIGMTGLELIEAVDADLLLEATPVDLRHGQPGLDIVRAALGRGMHCVLANKAPLALAYPELAGLTARAAQKPALRFSACVGGALPTINLGVRDLAGARIQRVEAILNGTCHAILRAMEAGEDFDAALEDAQRRGIVEADPTLDIDGWDQAVKLVILANAVLRRPTVLGDVTVAGIRGLRREDLAAARERGERIVLLGTAERETPNDDWTLAVGPASLPQSHRLARMGGDEMGVVYHTDISGILHATSEEADAVPTAAAMLRDLIEIVTGR